MFEPDPRMVQYLLSRYTQLGRMAGALHLALGQHGLRLPARGDLAKAARVSDATVSRRLKEGCSEERLVRALVESRARTFPPGWLEEGWARWVPDSSQDLADARVWLACLALASGWPAIAEAVWEVWAEERRALAGQILGRLVVGEVTTGVADDAEILQAVVLGLAVRHVLGDEASPARSLALLERAVAALRGCS